MCSSSSVGDSTVSGCGILGVPSSERISEPVVRIVRPYLWTDFTGNVVCVSTEFVSMLSSKDWPSLSSVLVTITATSSPPGFVRMEASLLSTPSSEPFDSTLCRFHRKSGVRVPACPGVSACLEFCQLFPLSPVSGSKEPFRTDSPTTIHRKRGVSVRATLFQHHRWAPETPLSIEGSFYLASNQIHRLRLTQAICSTSDPLHQLSIWSNHHGGRRANDNGASKPERRMATMEGTVLDMATRPRS